MIKRSVDKAIKIAASKAMESEGFVIIAKDGKIIKQYKNGYEVIIRTIKERTIVCWNT